MIGHDPPFFKHNGLFLLRFCYGAVNVVLSGQGGSRHRGSPLVPDLLYNVASSRLETGILPEPKGL